jgi:hypothetical protein
MMKWRKCTSAPLMCIACIDPVHAICDMTSKLCYSSVIVVLLTSKSRDSTLKSSSIYVWAPAFVVISISIGAIVVRVAVAIVVISISIGAIVVRVAVAMVVL